MIKLIGKLLPLGLLLAAMVLLLPNCDSQPGNAGTTQPGTSAASEPVGTTVPNAAPAAEARTVEEILDSKWLDETALSVCVYDPTLFESKDTIGNQGNAFELAGLCDEQRMNPIAAFWLLVEEGLYQKAEDDSGFLATPAFQVPEVLKKSYPNTAAGSQDLLTDVLIVAAMAADGMESERKLLGSDGVVNADQVFEKAGDCRYAYFVYYGDRSAHFLCFYLRGETEITDVELQLLSLRSASGSQETLEELDRRSERQASTLMAAAELLLTGTSRADQGRVPFGYELEQWKASVERFTFEGSGETGSLINYRIQK